AVSSAAIITEIKENSNLPVSSAAIIASQRPLFLEKDFPLLSPAPLQRPRLGKLRQSSGHYPRPDQSDSMLSKEEHNKKHGIYSWTACYNNDCPIHYSDKQGSGWFPQKPRGKCE